MKRLTEAWIEFNGVRNTAKYTRLLAMPKRPIAAKRGEQIEVPGRDGFLWQDENETRKPIEISVELETESGCTPDLMAEWLNGSGWLRFSDEPARAYKAHVVNEFYRENVFLRFDRQQYSIRFLCQPHRYIYPAAAAVALTATGSISNPGTASSSPKITIEGTGDMVVLIGSYRVDISGGGLIVDSEKKDCFELDGATLANSRVTMDEFPLLVPGANTISWTGSVSKITIDGRWRCL